MTAAGTGTAAAAGPCANPLCSCDPCGCGDACRCGAAKLSPLERRVMDCVWEAPDGAITVRNVADALPEYAYTTVATVLDRLVGKGVLVCDRTGRARRYEAIGGSGAHTAVLMREALLAERHPAAALRRFAATLGPAEADALRRALAEGT